MVWTSTGSSFNGGQEWLKETPNYSGYRFLSADVNGDGKADIIAVQPNPDRFVVWISTGSSFKSGQEWLKETPNYSGYWFLSADVNGDGKADVIAVQPNPDRFVVWTRRGLLIQRRRRMAERNPQL